MVQETRKYMNKEGSHQLLFTGDLAVLPGKFVAYATVCKC